MTAAQLATLLAFALWPPGSGLAADTGAAPEEIVVVGHHPGPPLWRVSNGEKTMWIFPYLSWVPADMVWDSARVARIIAEAQEVLGLPAASWVPPKGVMLNPIYVARNFRNAARTMRNPDGGSLEDNLPPELYARFAALQARYFPANAEIAEARPMYAGRTMMNIVRKREGLVPGDDILKTIDRLVRRNRGIERTEISVSEALGENFGEYEERLQAVYASFPRAQEQACFEQQLLSIEADIEGMKRRADGWAQGNVDEFGADVQAPPVFAELQACHELFVGASSPEHEALTRAIAQLRQRWLDAADRALATNASTFAILPIDELLAADGLLSTLSAKGYDIREP